MPETASGWPYPADTATPDVPRDIKAVADALEVKLPATTHQGAVTVTVTNAATATAAVTFPVGKFTATPGVVVSTTGTSFWCAFTSSVTANGFTATVRHIDGTVTAAASPGVAYFASQP